jgi:hypothetical protein
LAGISFLADVMVITDRIGELRHRRRVRRAEYARTRQEISNDSSRTGKSKTAAYPVLPVSIRISARYGYVTAVLTMSDFSRDHHRPEAPLLSAGPRVAEEGDELVPAVAADAQRILGSG